MIQAPSSQYIPVNYSAMPVSNPQTGANAVPTQPQYSNGFYNYPASSSYAQPKSQYNGVNIEILNPQGQGAPFGAPQPVQQQPVYQMPAQFVPVQQPIYQMPVQQQPVQQPVIEQPQQQAQQPAAEQPQQIIPQTPQQVPPPQIQTPEQAPQAQQAETPQAAAPVVGEPVAPDKSITPESFAGQLKTDDLDAQKNTIEQIAELVKNDDTAGPVLLDTQIFDALVDIIDKDTSNLEGPSPEILELRQKPQDELSDADKERASVPTPLEKAEINKQYALYTIAYMQERLNNELTKRNGSSLELKELPCIEKVVDTVKSNPNPMLRAGAISSLAHIAKPEYKEDLSVIFDLAKSDEDESVKEAATKAYDALNANSNQPA
ncbi:MAG: hypothetical protein LUG16_04615 [Candidatus Gastranaerophilales bacterium]|nr:hypothetical protein [Candidatus Gastranaerophilales bacterium]